MAFTERCRRRAARRHRGVSRVFRRARARHNVGRMADPRFIHLRVHTEYSLLEGAIRLKKLPGLCEAMEMPAVAVTDTNNLFSALEFSVTAAVPEWDGQAVTIMREEDTRITSDAAPAYLSGPQTELWVIR